MKKPNMRNSATLFRFRFGSVEFDEARLELSVGGLPVDLEQKPLQVLAALLNHPGEVVSREELLETVWAGRVTVEQVLANAVAKLRKALGESEGARIVTMPRVGYRFSGQFERIAVGTRLHSELNLKSGDAVPGREKFALDVQLSSNQGGEVWLAKDGSTGDRRVYKFAPNADRLGALKRETTLYRVLQEALGERDDLLKVFDWNFATPPFYLECEYGGDNLLQWAEHDNRLGRLSPLDRIALFLQIAGAVAMAHSVGVLHKDLKPTNVLVQERDVDRLQVRVADFGSGRLLDPDRLEELGITGLGMTVTENVASDSGAGTLLYYAPELLAGGQPTIQSDLYALGLMLYQIVTANLRKPMVSGWEDDVADDLLATDMAAATNGDPARRLTSVAELINRLRSLESRRQDREAERIALQTAQATQRALERGRIRRPWILAAVVALALGLGMTLTLYRKTAVLYADEKQARLEAEQAARRAEATNHFLSNDLLGAVDPSAPTGANNPSMRDVLNRAAASLEGRFAEDPDTKASIALVLGSAYFGLTDYANAEKYRRLAFTLLNTAQGPRSSATLEAQYLLILALMHTHSLDQIPAMLDDADRLSGSRLTENSRLAFEAHWTRAGYYKLRASAAQALPEYVAADRVRSVIDPDNASMLVRLKDSLSWCYMRLNRTLEAERTLHEVMTPYYTPERVGAAIWALARIDDGIVLMNLNRNDEAEQALTAALQEVRTSLGPDNNFVANVEDELAELYTRRGLWGAAADSLREAYRVVSLRSGPHSTSALALQANLGIVVYRTGNFKEAIKVLSDVRLELIHTLGEANPLTQFADFYLADVKADVGSFNEALLLITPLQPVELANAEPRDDWDARLRALRGEILVGQGHKAEGLALLAPAVAEMEKASTPAEDLDPFKRVLTARGK